MWVKKKAKSFNNKTCLIIKLEYDVYRCSTTYSCILHIHKQVVEQRNVVF